MSRIRPKPSLATPMLTGQETCKTNVQPQETVPTWMRSHPVVQQKTELGGYVDCRGRIHGSECHYSGSRLAETTPGGVRCDRGRSHFDLRRQPRSDLHGQESCLPQTYKACIDPLPLRERSSGTGYHYPRVLSHRQHVS